MTKNDLTILLDAIAPVIVDFVGDVVDPLTVRLKTAEEQLASARLHIEQMETKTFADWYRGVHQLGNTYERGLLVTSEGSLWLTLKQTDQRPGQSAHWKLVVKAGKNGKDATP